MGKSLERVMRQHNKKRRLNEESKIKHSKECVSVSAGEKTSRLAEGQARAKEKSPSRKSVNERSSGRAEAEIKGDLEPSCGANDRKCNDDDDNDNAK